MGKLFLGFIALALLELYLLIALGRALGFWATVGILLAISVVGTLVSRSQGARVMARWQEALNGGTMPAEGVLDGVLVLVGGALLIAPGFITDALGLSLLIPVSRAFWARHLRAWLERRVARGDVNVSMGGVSMGGLGGRPRGGRPGVRPVPGVIDIEGHEVRPDEPPLPALGRSEGED